MQRISFLVLALAVITSSCKKDNQLIRSSPITAGAVVSEAVSTLSFAGYTWTRTSSGSGTQGPGPNVFDPANAYVDSDGFLHLKITKSSTGTWKCAEVTINQNLGHGIYQWFVDGPIDVLDKNVVFGMFNYSGHDGYDEMDIEYSKWGVGSNTQNLDLTIYPRFGTTHAPAEVTQHVSLTGTYTTQRITWKATSVKCQSLGGFYDDDTNEFASHTFTSSDVPIATSPMPILMNLWLYNGKAPSNGKNVEIIIHDFKFTPLP